MNEKWFEKMSDYKCVNATLLVAKLKRDGIRLSVMVVYAPYNDRDEGIKDAFRRKLERAIKNIDLRKKMCLMGYLNVWVGDRVQEEVTDGYGVPGINDNKEHMDCLHQQV